MKRTLEDVQSEYNAQAAILGDLVYRIGVMNLDMARMKKRLKDLNKEAARIAGKEAPKEEVVSESTEG